MEKHRTSRKLAFIMLAVIFLNSVLTLKLRNYQRHQNLNLLRSRLKSESNKEIFDNIEEKSKKEDMLLLIGTNIAALIIIAGFDRQRMVDEDKEKKIVVKVFGRQPEMAIFFCGMKKSQYFKNRVKSLFYKFVKFIFKIVGKNKNT